MSGMINLFVDKEVKVMFRWLSDLPKPRSHSRQAYCPVLPSSPLAEPARVCIVPTSLVSMESLGRACHQDLRSRPEAVSLECEVSC